MDQLAVVLARAGLELGAVQGEEPLGDLGHGRGPSLGGALGADIVAAAGGGQDAQGFAAGGLRRPGRAVFADVDPALAAGDAGLDEIGGGVGLPADAEAA